MWRRSLGTVPEADGGWAWAARSYMRMYMLDGGFGREVTTGAEKELFYGVDTFCRIDECQTHNGQLAAIMQSLRLKP